MPRNYFTPDEITLCTYAALYEGADFGGVQAVCRIAGRPRSSVDMKIRNIASMLDARGIQRSSSVSGLTGRTTGEDARKTNWELVEPLTSLNRETLLERCRSIVSG